MTKLFRVSIWGLLSFGIIPEVEIRQKMSFQGPPHYFRRETLDFDIVRVLINFNYVNFIFDHLYT